MAVNPSQYCSSGATCENSNSTSAALAFATSPTYPHYGSVASTTVIDGQTVNTGSTIVNGTQIQAGYGTSAYTYGDGTLYSTQNQTRDTDLQQAQMQQAQFYQRAAAVSANFQMDFSKAVQLTTLSDKLDAIRNQGQALSDDDRAAMMQNLSGIVGVTSDDVSNAVVAQLKGNVQPTQDLIEAISKNLGMPSSTTLKDQILPQLGLGLD
jgi:phosphoglycerol transferase MdoB-like AlkP superfamily enzyme